MNTRKTLIVAAAAVLGVLAIGTGVVLAGGFDDDKPLTGDALQRATRAALEHAGGGTVIETEAGDDGAAYGIEIRTDDGTVVEVNLDENFKVIGSEPDDDGTDDAEDADGTDESRS